MDSIIKIKATRLEHSYVTDIKRPYSFPQTDNVSNTLTRQGEKTWQVSKSEVFSEATLEWAVNKKKQVTWLPYPAFVFVLFLASRVLFSTLLDTHDTNSFTVRIWMRQGGARLHQLTCCGLNGFNAVTTLESVTLKVCASLGQNAQNYLSDMWHCSRMERPPRTSFNA